jgi:ketosteroid isomerase-like protein
VNVGTHEAAERFLINGGQAMASKDAERIGSFASPEWVQVTPEAGPVDRERFLAAVASAVLMHDTFEVDVARFVDFGDTPIARAHVRNTGLFQGAPFKAGEWATDVLVRRDGGRQYVMTAQTPGLRAT